MGRSSLISTAPRNNIFLGELAVQIEAQRAAMMTVTSLRRSAAEMTCHKCGNALIAPEWSYDFLEEGLVINLWSCMNCGNQFETEIFAIDGRAKIDNRAWEESLPSAA
jgi:RNase P subunit RPR2